MPSMYDTMYADYMRERSGMETLFSDSGFVTYCPNGDNYFISDIYIMPHRRKSGEGRKLADRVAQIAIQDGKKYLSSLCDRNTPIFESSYEAQKAYGFEVIAEAGDVLSLAKDLTKWKVHHGKDS